MLDAAPAGTCSSRRGVGGVGPAWRRVGAGGGRGPSPVTSCQAAGAEPLFSVCAACRRVCVRSPSSDPRPGGARLLRGHSASSLPRSLFPRPLLLLLPLLAAAQHRRPRDELWGSSQVRRPGPAGPRKDPRRHGVSGRWAAGGLGLAGARAAAQARLRPRGLPGGGGPSALPVGPVPVLTRGARAGAGSVGRPVHGAAATTEPWGKVPIPGSALFVSHFILFVSLL